MGARPIDPSVYFIVSSEPNSSSKLASAILLGSTGVGFSDGDMIIECFLFEQLLDIYLGRNEECLVIRVMRACLVICRV